MTEDMVMAAIGVVRPLDAPHRPTTTAAEDDPDVTTDRDQDHTRRVSSIFFRESRKFLSKLSSR